MISSLIPWVRKPFTILSAANGFIGDRIYTASYLGLSDEATFTIDRVLGVSQTLSLSQSDYWVDTASDAMVLAQTLSHDKQRPLAASSSVAFVSSVSASGGKFQEPILEVTADGIVLAGQAIYIKSSGHAAVADADVSSTEASVAGIAVSGGGGITSGPLLYRTDGHIYLEDWTDATGSADLTPGAPYYLSTTAGYITSTPPTGDGEWVVKVGRAINARLLDIELGEGTAL
jgi:hypothetical protein